MVYTINLRWFKFIGIRNTCIILILSVLRYCKFNSRRFELVTWKLVKQLTIEPRLHHEFVALQRGTQIVRQHALAAFLLGRADISGDAELRDNDLVR